MKVWVLGSIAEGALEGAEELAKRLLAAPSIELAHGSMFTGKHATRLHVIDGYVLKYRIDRSFETVPIAERWGQHRIHSERIRGIYHPQRTWIAFVDPASQLLRVGNLSPQLLPLHKLAWRRESDPVQWLIEVLRLYYHNWHQREDRLDEGLSNFGLDSTGRLWYLDDDFYPWDEHQSAAAMLAQWMRLFSRQWLNNEAAARLGEAIGKIFESFPYVELELLLEALRDQYLDADADERRSALLAAAKQRRLAGKSTEIAFSSSQAPDWSRPVGLLADVHANLPALLAVEKAMRAKGVEQFFCLGDIVGYGPWPAECIAWMQKNRVFCLRGNHDHFIAHGSGKVAMTKTARQAAEWTQCMLSDRDKAWLGSLPLKYQNRSERLLAVHGSPMDPTYFNGYVYEMTWENNLDWLQRHRVALCLHGHSHLQGVWFDNNVHRGHFEPQPAKACFELPDGHCLLNPGSVGQPRNRRPGAQAAILDLARRRVEFLCVPYEISTVAERMRRVQLPQALIDRLFTGQ